MNELIKKGFYLGLGAALASKEKAEKYVRDFVTNGDLAPEEAKKLLVELGEKGKEKQEEWSKQFQQGVSESFKQLGFVTVEEFEDTKQQLNRLEEKLDALLKNANQE
ncbi:phasin family protein [Heyndrickxia sp. NPDC080065]|uniref:phasin family protein n=1 Tax=Heyndrickxia sp. NPDC080065 TaxID=3390568 RepID=UPI003D06C527